MLFRSSEPRLHSISLGSQSHAVGLTIAELGLDALDVTVAAVRRRDTRIAKPSAATTLQGDDVLVLLGTPEKLAAAEIRLMQGH